MQRAYRVHPVRIMAHTVVSTLADAGYTIMSGEDLDREIALAHQAGYDEGRESVGSNG